MVCLLQELFKIKIMNKLPAGLVDNNLEFIENNGVPFVVYMGRVLPYEESVMGRDVIHHDMMVNIELVAEFSKEFDIHGIELEKKWVICRFGGFNLIPDFEQKYDKHNVEYHYCPNRSNCQLSGQVCMLPEGPGGKLTHREIETLQVIAEGDAIKMAAERMHVKETTIKTFIKNIHKKLRVNNRAELVKYAFKNNLL
jgi:DNA-binding CsgD family transcriptional regulator